MILHYIIVPASVLAQWFLKCKTLHIFDHTCCSPTNLVDCIYYTLLFHIRDLLEENITCQIQQPEKPCPQLQPAAGLRLYSQQAHTQSTHTHHIYTHIRGRPHRSQTDTWSTHMNTDRTNGLILLPSPAES